MDISHSTCTADEHQALNPLHLEIQARIPPETQLLYGLRFQQQVWLLQKSTLDIKLDRDLHVIIYDQAYYLDFNSGFNVPTVIQTDIAFSKVKLKLEPIMYSNCSYTGVENISNKNYSDIITRNNLRYSRSECKLACFGDYLWPFW